MLYKILVANAFVSMYTLSVKFRKNNAYEGAKNPMKLTWLGQHGIALESQGCLLMSDPYLLDTMYQTVGESSGRRIPIDESWTKVRPDMILLTHDHIDHVDMPSLEAIVSDEKQVEILAAPNAWNKVRGQLCGDHNYIMMKPGNEWSSAVFRIRAIQARHSDETGVGYVVEAEGLTIVISGDTLYFSDAAKEISKQADIAIVVMNGKGNNMNCTDASRYCADIQAKVAIPTHWGLLKKFADDQDTPELFAQKASELGVKTRILQIYETVDTEVLLRG